MLQLTIQIAVNGLTFGLIYILMALGFTLIFGIMRVVNFAHGEFYMVGAIGILLLFGTLGFNYYLSIVFAVLCVGLLGVIVERVLLRGFVGRELNSMIMALAVAITLQALAAILFGPQEQSVARPVTGVLQVAGVFIPRDRIVVGVIALAVLIAFYLFLRYARYGLAMRAVAQDPAAAALQGIRPGFIYSLAFGVGSLLAGLAGALMAPVYTISPFMGDVPMMMAFIVVILGGLGSIPGAVVGGLLLGFVESLFSTFFGSTIATMIAFGMVVLILLFKPSGLMGRAQ
ncbi:MAG: branched-chain amino acid ABC transporter permease [Ectothiorhodospiraceae bacterium]|nr:branched-chain amino acid ABC transporter permease [Ectothiorhodospiraceae bacterium]